MHYYLHIYIYIISRLSLVWRTTICSRFPPRRSSAVRPFGFSPGVDDVIVERSQLEIPAIRNQHIHHCDTGIRSIKSEEYILVLYILFIYIQGTTVSLLLESLSTNSSSSKQQQQQEVSQQKDASVPILPFVVVVVEMWAVHGIDGTDRSTCGWTRRTGSSTTNGPIITRRSLLFIILLSRGAICITQTMHYYYHTTTTTPPQFVAIVRTSHGDTRDGGGASDHGRGGNNRVTLVASRHHNFHYNRQ